MGNRGEDEIQECGQGLAHIPATIDRNRLPGHVVIHRQHHRHGCDIVHRTKMPHRNKIGFALGLLVTISVSISAGAMAFTVIPSLTKAEAQECVSPISPPWTRRSAPPQPRPSVQRPKTG